MLLPNEIIVDNFAGGGGASTGIEQALNRHVDIAINHDPDAIDMHKLNHPKTKHYCESVWDVDPVEACAGRPVGLGWFSPDCRHFSIAKGGQPVDKNIRGLAWVVVRWAALVPMRVFKLENVQEFLTWGPLVEVSPGNFKPDSERQGETFDAFIKCMTTGLNKVHRAWTEIKEALGDNFPYDKLEKGLGYKIEHRTLSACDYGVPTTRKRLFMVGRNDGKAIVWPKPTHGPKGSGLQPYKTAADIIDWSIPVRSIFGRKRPLVEATLNRIAKGIQKFVECEDPYLVPEENVLPFINEHANASNQRVMNANEPLRTICAQVKGGHFSIVTSHVIKLRGDNLGHRTDEPLHTISAGGNHLGAVQAFLIKYYGTGAPKAANEPLGTITTKDRFGVVVIKGEKYQIVDIGLRMLEPHELFAAMGFPKDYMIAYNSNGKKNSKRIQVARCGNAVCPLVAKVLVEANFITDDSRIAA
ncbi:DNA cytosine methyltransferase [Pseudoalteromonas obscura]|uniref:DNA (cytosine-5-)-methyltransferase n=1 Tax=Pseudoalteromonas obscura TaxID=3048491 RepID=A0ABT7ESD4_9GAMM|nr:DNA cytosine methyltransferase [Pseudoalteromonas sp. P94(2023)]MDK2597918.1 DNA cytosine methyltransferase [Pseudoalteromonas sp. P94(2023)]